MTYDIADPSLVVKGRNRIAWAAQSMPVLAQIAERRRLLRVPIDVAIVLPTRLY